MNNREPISAWLPRRPSLPFHSTRIRQVMNQFWLDLTSLLDIEAPQLGPRQKEMVNSRVVSQQVLREPQAGTKTNHDDPHSFQGRGSAQSVDVFVSSSDAASHVSFALSDHVVSEGGSLSSLTGWAAAQALNSRGQRVFAHTLPEHSSTSGLGLLHGLSGGGASTITVAAGPASFSSLGQLQSQGVVVHFSPAEGGDDALLGLGGDAIVLQPASPQEAHDCALVAHAVSLAQRQPVVIALGANAATDSCSVRLLRWPDVLATVEAARVRATASSPAFTSTSTSTALSAAFASVSSAVGAPISPFEYSGHAAPLVVVIALGTAGAALGVLAHRLNAACGLHIGVLRPLVLRPLDGASLLAALPPSTRTIVTLNVTATRGSEGATQQQPASGAENALFALVAAALKNKSATGPTSNGLGHRTASEAPPALLSWLHSSPTAFGPSDASRLVCDLAALLPLSGAPGTGPAPLPGSPGVVTGGSGAMPAAPTISPSAVAALLAAAAAPGAGVSPADAVARALLPHPPQSGAPDDLVVWGLSHDGVQATTDGTRRVLQRFLDAGSAAAAAAPLGSIVRRGLVSLPPAPGSSAPRPLGVTYTRLACPTGPHAGLQPSSALAVVSHASLLAHFNVPASLREGGVLLVNGAGAAAAAAAAASSARGQGATAAPGGDASALKLREDEDAPVEQLTETVAAVLGALGADDVAALAAKHARLLVIDAAAVAQTVLTPGALAEIGAAAGDAAPPGTKAAAAAAAVEAATAALAAAALQAASLLAAITYCTGASSSSSSGFARVAAALECEQRAALPAPLHPALPLLYSRVRLALTRVPLPPAAPPAKLLSPSQVAAPRPLLPTETTLRFGAAAPATSTPGSRCASVPGFGPTEWARPHHAGVVGHHSHGKRPVLASKSQSPLVASPAHHAALSVLFPAAFRTVAAPSAASPAPEAPAASAPSHDAHSTIYTGTVTVNRRLTPLDYDRNIFHLEVGIGGTGLRYQIGSALGVHGHNPPGEVEAFLAAAYPSLAPSTVVSLPTEDGSGRVRLTTAFRLLSEELDLCGAPSRDFYASLAAWATDPAEAALLTLLGSGEGSGEAFKSRADESWSHADALLEFPSARPPLASLAGPGLLPPIKPRHYSIASAQCAHPDSVHLLVVEVGWRTPAGRHRFGQCSHYLASLAPGSPVFVSVLPSEMHLPLHPGAPVVMAGLGTGMAPFRAFLQARAHAAASGVVVGPMALYMGSRSKAQEYLYGDELEAWVSAGVLTRLRPAFSRDGPRKVYIQHLMEEDGAHLAGELGAGGGAFYLCGPTWPEADVEAAITNSLTAHGGPGVRGSREAAAGAIAAMKADKRYVLELY